MSMPSPRFGFSIMIIIFLLAAGCGNASLSLSPAEQIPVEQRSAADWIVVGARQEVRNKTRYDASYMELEYPGGDVPADRGACTDVVVRALREAGYDLQQLMHEDMTDHFQEYPSLWGLSRPDANIDHRRVPNQMTFFFRHGMELTTEVTGQLEKWQWGDIVCWRYSDGRHHTGIISDRTNPDGVPLVIHNAWVAREEDCLERWDIVGHYRYPAE